MIHNCLSVILYQLQVVKGAVKLQGGSVSKWFVLSYTFNIITYIATFLFIWTPQLFAYNDYNPDLKVPSCSCNDGSIVPVDLLSTIILVNAHPWFDAYLGKLKIRCNLACFPNQFSEEGTIE